MFIPPGFCQQSVSTSLGKMVYYTPNLPSASPQYGKPSLVFLHGFGGGSSAYEWSKVFPAFAFEYQVLAPDLIGWGRSDHPERNYLVEDYVSTILEFLEQTTQEATTVIASSLTAAIVVRAAIARPELFKSLVLSAPAGLADFGEDNTRNFFTQLVKTPVIDRLIYRVGIANRDGIRRFLEERQFANPKRIYPEIVEAYLASAQQPNAEYAALSFVRGDLSFDLSLYLPQLKVPTTMIWGKEANLTKVEIGNRLVQLNPDAIKQYLVLEDSGLTPHLELPAIAIGQIRKHLSLFF